MRVQAPLQGMPVCEHKSTKGWSIWDRMHHWAELVDRQQQQQGIMQQGVEQGMEVSKGMVAKV